MDSGQECRTPQSVSGHRRGRRKLTKVSSVAELRRAIASLRARLEPAFRPDTAIKPVECPRSVSAGHCCAVATIVRAMLGGEFVSADVDEQSHWFNRIPVAGDLFDVDITGDQFGLPAIQVARCGRLYSRSRSRHPDEVDENTQMRAALLAKRAGVGDHVSSETQ